MFKNEKLINNYGLLLFNFYLIMVIFNFLIDYLFNYIFVNPANILSNKINFKLSFILSL